MINKNVFFIYPETPNICIGRGQIKQIITMEENNKVNKNYLLSNVIIIPYNDNEKGKAEKIKEFTIPEEYVFFTEDEFLTNFNKWIEFIYCTFLKSAIKYFSLSLSEEEVENSSFLKKLFKKFFNLINDRSRPLL